MNLIVRGIAGGVNDQNSERIHFLSSRFVVYLEHYFYQLVSLYQQLQFSS